MSKFIRPRVKQRSEKVHRMLAFFSYRRTAFYSLSLIAQTPDGAMTLKGFGWETYRVRAHSIPSSIINTDAYQSNEKRLSNLLSPTSPTKSLSPVPTDTVFKRETSESANGSKQFRFSHIQELGLPQLKAQRSLTMPTSILLNSNEIPPVQHGKSQASFKVFRIDHEFF